ncbi:class I SAM-dependent methyltransferase [Halobacteriovorax sp. HLS]|uniref:class I SAM-dependent methyltransferase n=1 Tax=Halobacteriovorax sp. HLS TaxID=2234000 RepID=UPI000FDCA957|nr:class I SAM-dependent methyltransferase [Halobacteriovorax sp. HLS]
MSEIKNKLLKNYKHKKKWAKKNNFECYRLYDKEIPQYPYLIDIYGKEVILYDRRIDKIDSDKEELYLETICAICEVLNIDQDSIIIKKRIIQTKENKYTKLDKSKNKLVVAEGRAKSIINLHDYIDTGLFLDHRPMRMYLNTISKDKKLLNLFCYTSMVSVHAALGGASTTNVDLSNTYLEWSKENFQVNEINLENHHFINADVFKYLEQNKMNKFDIIFLDPPTFSNSKKMTDILDIQRDQNILVSSCMNILNENGVLYFSNNKRGFSLNEIISQTYNVKDISLKTIPEDFKDKKIHVCFEIRNK